MLFENVNQFKEAKKILLENERNITRTVHILKGSRLFASLSEGEIILGVTELNEGLGDWIANYVSNAIGGDIKVLKTVLAQMKGQELKYNKEEFEIYNEFYKILQDQKILDKDRNNPNYQSLNNDIQMQKNGLNTRMKELNKTHGDIFDALETKVTDLTEDSNRKKKYFNAQRASDVFITKNDRYKKIKAVTAMSSRRSQDLEDFFGVSVQQAQQNAQQAQQNAQQAVNALGNPTAPGAPAPVAPAPVAPAPVAPAPAPNQRRNLYANDPEKGFYDDYKSIVNGGGNRQNKLSDFRMLERAIFNYLMRGNLPLETVQNLKDIHALVSDEIISMQIIVTP